MIQGLIQSRGKIFFSSTKHPDWLWGPPSLLFNGCWGSFCTFKWQRHKGDHSPPSSAKLRILGAIPLLHGMHRDNVTFTFKSSWDS